MTKKDIIFALICGLAVAWIGTDFFSKYALVFFILLPVLSVFGLWVADLIGKKFLFVRQAAKFSLAGGFADVVDIKAFQLLFWLLPFSLFIKAISFVAGTLVKYFCDKYWAFNTPENDPKSTPMHKEMIKFFLVAGVGLLINVVSFYFFGKIKTSMPAKTWTELVIILATIVTAVWNFCGYKYLVFKK